MSPSNEQEGSLIKCLREISCLFDSPWEISNGGCTDYEQHAIEAPMLQTISSLDGLS